MKKTNHKSGGEAMTIHPIRGDSSGLLCACAHLRPPLRPLHLRQLHAQMALPAVSQAPDPLPFSWQQRVQAAHVCCKFMCFFVLQHRCVV